MKVDCDNAVKQLEDNTNHAQQVCRTLPQDSNERRECWHKFLATRAKWRPVRRHACKLWFGKSWTEDAKTSNNTAAQARFMATPVNTTGAPSAPSVANTSAPASHAVDSRAARSKACKEAHKLHGARLSAITQVCSPQDNVVYV